MEKLTLAEIWEIYFDQLAEYEKAKDHFEKSLAIQKEIGDRKGEAISYAVLGFMYQSLGKYEKARKHLEQSLVIQKEIGDRHGEAASYRNLGNVYQSFGGYENAKEHFKKSLAIQQRNWRQIVEKLPLTLILEVCVNAAWRI